jgi:hypothetical protein
MNRPPNYPTAFRWPESADAPERAEEKRDVASNEFRQTVRNLVQIANAAFEFVIATSDRAYVNCDVVVDPRGDQNLQNAVVKLYAITADVRVLVQTVTLTSILVTQRICSVQGRGVTRWEVTVTPSGLGPGNPVKTSWVLVTYGTSAGAGQITGLATGIGAANSFLQTDPTAAFGVWNANPQVGSGNVLQFLPGPFPVNNPTGFVGKGFIQWGPNAAVTPLLTIRDAGVLTLPIISVGSTTYTINVGDPTSNAGTNWTQVQITAAQVGLNANNSNGVQFWNKAGSSITPIVTIFSGAAALPILAVLGDGTTGTTVRINQRASNGAAGQPLILKGETNTGTGNADGGPIQLTGGDPAATGTRGPVQVTTPTDLGRLAYSFPTDANQSLTVAQSDAMFFDIQSAVITAGRTITVNRRATNAGQMYVKNRTAFTVTMQWLTGTSVAFASGASGWVGTDGVNMVDMR